MMKNIALNFHVNNMRGRLSAMEMAFCYVVANLCVKADPLLLLPIKISIGSTIHRLEDCGVIGAPDDKHFEIYVRNQEIIPQVIKGIVLKHPLLEVEMKEKETDDDPDILSVTVPKMSKERHDALKDVIKVKYEQIKGQMEIAYGKAVQETADLGSKVKPEEIDECKKELLKAHNDVLDILNNDYDDIIKYIEKEYEAYCAGDVELQKHEAEDNAAMDDSVAKKMKL